MQYGLSDVDTMLWHISQGTDHLRALGLFHDQPVIRTEEALLQLANWISPARPPIQMRSWSRVIMTLTWPSWLTSTKS
jgi:hypothetical protein